MPPVKRNPGLDLHPQNDSWTDDRPKRDDRRDDRNASSIIASSIIANSGKGSADGGLSQIVGLGQGNSGVSALNAVCLRNTANILCNNGVETDVTFDTLDWKGNSFNWSSAASKKVILAYGNNGIEINGTVTFAANAAGTRKFAVYFYNAAGSSLGSKVIFNLPATSSGAITVPFSFPIYLPALYPNTAYLQFTGTQDSGSNINITEIIMSVYVIV